MRGFIGLCLLITGLSIGAYSYYPGPVHRQASLSELTEIVTGAIPNGQFGGISQAIAGELAKPHAVNKKREATGKSQFQRRGWFANAKILETKKFSGAQKQKPAQPILVQEPRRLKATDRPKQRVISTTWRTAVVKVDAASAVAGKRITSLKPKTKAERWELAKALQRELKRVGCYWGKIDGVWGKGSKWAMTDFMQAVNAALPTQDPDYILLQLVSSHSEKICGRQQRGVQIAQRAKQKPSGGWQTQVAATKKSASPTYRVAAKALPDDAQAVEFRRRPPLPGRMAVGALRRDARPQLEAPPMRISREAALPQPADSARNKQKRVKISALPTRQPTPNSEGQTAYDGEVLIDPVVAKKRNAAKLRRDRALRKAAVKKKRKRWRRRYHRRRSLQSIFMHPLGRR